MILKYHFSMRNVFTLLFLIVTNTGLTQEESVIIYVDNSISVNRASRLSKEVSKVLDESNEVGFLIFGNAPIHVSTDGQRTVTTRYTLHHLKDENLRNNIDLLCLEDHEAQRPQEIVRILSEVLYSHKLVVIKDNKQEQMVNLELHLFFNISTFVQKKMFKEVVNIIRTDLKLKEDKTNIVIHLDNQNKKDHYNEYIDNILHQSKNIKINLY